MKELEFDSLTLEQKIGLVMTAQCQDFDDEFDYALELIRKRSLGCIKVLPKLENYAEKMRRIHEAADYPILIATDAESGLGDYIIGQHGALGYADSDELAYAFGKVTGITARKMGYNLVFNPVVDMADRNYPCGVVPRSLGSNVDRVSAMAVAIAKGLHDGGVLSMAKHYPSAQGLKDTHMSEGEADLDENDLRSYCFKPYMAMMEAGVLDSIMTDHTRLPKIDPEYPASLSPKVLGILRKMGFDGVMLTDALCMMGVVAKYGKYACKGLAIANGNDLAMGWDTPNTLDYAAIREAYDKGILTEERLNEAVRRVLAMQHKAMLLSKDAEITPEDEEAIRAINRDCIAAVCDEGVSPMLDPNGKHFFVIIEEFNTMMKIDYRKMAIDPASKGWYRPDEIEEHIRKRFPNSGVTRICEFPTASQNVNLLNDQLPYDDVVFVTMFPSGAYIGRECFTSRLISLMEALQVTNRISTIVHFGNPFLLEEAPHFPRKIFGAVSYECTLNAIDVLAGLSKPMGTLPFQLKLP